MKLIVAGGRDFTNSYYMLECLVSLDLPDDVQLVSGMARGADLTAFHLWKRIGNPIIEMPADWATYGKSAGYRRNTEMAAVADALVAFWDGESRGTKNMIETMQRLGKLTHIFRY